VPLWHLPPPKDGYHPIPENEEPTSPRPEGDGPYLFPDGEWHLIATDSNAGGRAGSTKLTVGTLYAKGVAVELVGPVRPFRKDWTIDKG
jgi:hypothetical protein